MPNQPEQPERTVVIEDESLRQFAGGFTAIPNRILRNGDISLGARMCYAMLLSYAWQKDFCHPAQLCLAEDLGIGERTVRQYLSELRDRGLITWKQRGLNRPNIYRILKFPVLAPSGGNGRPGPAGSADPDRQDVSGQDRKQASDKEDSMKNTHVDNVVETISSKEAGEGRRLSRDEYAKAKGLALQIQDTIGQQENYPAYFARAAEAVRRGHRGVQALLEVLSVTKDAHLRGRVKTTPSQYFQRTWKRVLPSLGTPLPASSGSNDRPGPTDGPDAITARLAVQEFLTRPRVRGTVDDDDNRDSHHD